MPKLCPYLIVSKRLTNARTRRMQERLESWNISLSGWPSVFDFTYHKDGEMSLSIRAIRLCASKGARSFTSLSK